MSDDLSDEAYELWRCDEGITVRFVAKKVWREAARRAEAQIEAVLLREAEKEGKYLEAIKELTEQIEKVRREAFEAGCGCVFHNKCAQWTVHEAYYAWREQRGISEPKESE
jgi:hypothetical protein